MPDVFGPDTRSRIMQQIRSRDTKPELRVRRFLHAAGLRFRLHDSSLPGKPDIVLRRHRTVILVQGCFWHQHPGCKHSGVPLSRRRYWGPKLRATVHRDREHQRKLRSLKWRVLVLWECRITEARLHRLVERLKGRLNGH